MLRIKSVLVLLVSILLVSCTKTDGPCSIVVLSQDVGKDTHTQLSGSNSPVSCYLYPEGKYLSIVSTSGTKSASVIIENLGTGLKECHTVELSSEPTSIPVGSNGSYIIEIHLPDGSMYVGEFSL